MSQRHITWDNLLNLINAGAPFRLRIPGTPVTEVMIDAGASALSLLVQVPSEIEVAPTELQAIQTSLVVIDGISYVRVSTCIRPLFREFYSLLTEIADSAQVDNEPPLKAIHDRIESWKELLQAISVLGIEQQLGLMGELWLLGRLIGVHGTQTLDNWVGPLAEPHDFRMTGVEIEVKATRNRQRLHIITSLDQLLPSAGHELHILSLQFEPAATQDSWSLRQAVAAIRARLGPDFERSLRFDRMLVEGCGYLVANEEQYGKTFRLRTQPILVPVDNQCPALTRGGIQTLLGAQREQRVTDIRYTVNLDGLGVPDGSPGFLAVIPEATTHSAGGAT